MKSYSILGVRVDSFAKKDLLKDISVALDKASKIFVVTQNPEGVMLAKNNADFKRALSEATYATADGAGLLWAATFLRKWSPSNILKYLYVPVYAVYSLVLFFAARKFFKKEIPERITGSDLTWDILEIANVKNKNVFLLGGYGNVAEIAKGKILEKYPKLNIAGVSSGNPDDQNLVDDINRANVDILFVAWGQPKQELWISKNLDRLDIKLAMGVGGTFDFISGIKKRAPRVFQKSGLEWLWRFFIEPKRASRIFAAVPKFIYAVVKEKINNPKKEILIDGN